jgi:hypothetical protein
MSKDTAFILFVANTAFCLFIIAALLFTHKQH